MHTELVWSQVEVHRCTELGSWQRAWRRVGKAEVEVEVDADMVEEKLEEEAEEEDEEEDIGGQLAEEEENNSDKI